MKTTRLLLLSLLCICTQFHSFSQTIIGRQLVDQYATTAWGTPTSGLTWLPDDYSANPTKKYPLIIFLHGAGEAGYNLWALTSTALPQRIANGWNPQAVNPVDGQTYKFIVASPQAPSWSYSLQHVQHMLTDLASRYRVDTSRVYVTGLSAGGAGTLSVYLNGPQAAKRFAAIVPICPAGTNTPAEDAQLPLVGGTYGGKVWTICGANDSWMAFSTQMTQTINTATPPPAVPALLTSIPGAGHDPSAWNTAYDPAWRPATTNKNVYEWMLQYTRTSTGPNLPPVVSAGPDINLTWPLNNTTLTGNATDPDGSITAYQWSIASSPASATFGSANAASTTVSNLSSGTYVFRLTATDNSGATAFDEVQVHVSQPRNTPPVAFAGVDTSITLPANSVQLTGSGTDADGIIKSVLWTKLSGPSSYQIVDVNNAQTMVTNLVAGSYQFVLSVTDDSSAVAHDTVSVTVNTAPNQLPIVWAGNDTLIQLPGNAVTLMGTASDPDGVVSQTAWTKLSGPSAFRMLQPASLTTVVDSLAAGQYQFELTATDNKGGTGRDTVEVIVLSARNNAPSVTAGRDTIIYRPADSVFLDGTATDLDGSVLSVHWTQVAGPAVARIRQPAQLRTLADSLQVGVYTFALTATDDSSASTADTVTITVRPFNQAPSVAAGQDQTIYLPTNAALLQATAIDSDGVVVSHRWRKISGPVQGRIVHPNSLQTQVDSLVQGYYVFEIRIVDNAGVFAVDTVRINVMPVVVNSCNGVKRYFSPRADGGVYMVNDPTNATWYQPVNPGDTLVLRSSFAWSYFSIDGYKGTPACPIVIMNDSLGPVQLQAGISIQSSQYIKVTGSGHAGSFYGIRVITHQPETGGVALGIVGKSRCVEVERAEVYGKSYGVWIKQDPLCDTSYNYPNYYMDSIEVHHCRFRKLGQSGVYAGNTDPLGLRTYGCNGLVYNFVPMRLSNINIHHLVIDSTGRSGIQLGGADRGYNQIHNNIISNTGFEYNPHQGTGISIGGMTRNCRVYNNQIRNTFIYGIMSFGVGTNFIENNTIDSSGFLGGVPNMDGPFNILVSPKETLPFDSTRIIIRNNKIGANPLASGEQIFMVTWGPPHWARNNVVCGNTKLDGITPAKSYIEPTIHVIDSCTQAIPNLAPTSFAGSNVRLVIPADSTFLRGAGTDLDGVIVGFLWTQVSGPNQAQIVNPTSAETAVRNLVPGTYVLRLTVMDDDSATASATTTIYIGPPNNKPSLNAGADQTIRLPLQSVVLQAQATDPDGVVIAYAWKRISGPSSAVFSAPLSSRTTVDSLVVGVYEMEVAIADNEGAIVKDTVKITVLPPNMAPVADAGPDQLITLPTNQTSLIGTGSDADGQIVSYQWVKINGPASYAITTPANAQTGVTGMVAGVYFFELSVTDNDGAIGRDTVMITVLPQNVLPVINAGPDQVLVLPNDSTMLTGTAVDPDGTIVNTTWTKISGPPAGIISNAGSLTTPFRGLTAGTYVLVLAATDDRGDVVSDTLRITVYPVPNVRPSVNAGPDQTITLPANQVVLNGSASDPDGTIVSQQWTKIAGPAAHLFSAANQLQTSVSGLVRGTYSFELLVTDDSGAIARDTVLIHVLPAPNQPPVVYAGADITITLPQNSVSLSGIATDPDGQIGSTLWTKISGPTSGIIATPSSLQTLVNGLVHGVYEIELMAADNDGALVRDTMRITVLPKPNVPPTANAGSDITIKLPVNHTVLIGTGVDSDGQVAAYEWTKVSGPAAFTILTPTSPATIVAGMQQGVYKYRLKVIDNSGDVGYDTVLVTVLPANLPPVPNAGADITLDLPKDTATLRGSGTDADGQVVRYQWRKISGPNTFQLQNATMPHARLVSLEVGVYQFELAVTDNEGAVGRDTVTVSVNFDSRRFPTTTLYPNPASDVIFLTINAKTQKNWTLVQIVDAAGRVVLEDEFHRNAPTVVRQIDVSRLKPGTYVLQFNPEINTQKAIKFVKL